jgi:hypothetical protein
MMAQNIMTFSIGILTEALRASKTMMRAQNMDSQLFQDYSTHVENQLNQPD